MDATKHPSYPEQCPHCEAEAGWPFSAGTCERPGIIIVHVRCQHCGQAWISDAPKAPMASVTLWTKRPDRRRTRHRAG